MEQEKNIGQVHGGGKKIVIALVVLVIVGVGAYYLVFNKNSDAIPTDTSATPTSSLTNTPESPAVSSVTVYMKNLAFTPSTLPIKVNTKVTWTNHDTVPHTVTSDSGILLRSNTIAPGQSFSFTFTKTGSENYHCSIHPMMKGAIVVTN